MTAGDNIYKILSVPALHRAIVGHPTVCTPEGAQINFSM
jgi:hypothetical protein